MLSRETEQRVRDQRDQAASGKPAEVKDNSKSGLVEQIQNYNQQGRMLGFELLYSPDLQAILSDSIRIGNTLFGKDAKPITDEDLHVLSRQVTHLLNRI